MHFILTKCGISPIFFVIKCILAPELKILIDLALFKCTLAPHEPSRLYGKRHYKVIHCYQK